MKLSCPMFGAWLILLGLSQPAWSQPPNLQPGYPEQQIVELTEEELNLMELPEIAWREDGKPLHMPVLNPELPLLEAKEQYAKDKKAWIANYPHEYYGLIEKMEAEHEQPVTWLTFYSEPSGQVVRQTWDPRVPRFMLYPVDSAKPRYYDTGNPYQDKLFFRRRMQKWCYFFARETYNRHFEPIDPNIDGYHNLGYRDSRFPIVLHDVSYADFVRKRFPDLPPPGPTPPSPPEEGRPVLPPTEQPESPTDSQDALDTGPILQPE